MKKEDDELSTALRPVDVTDLHLGRKNLDEIKGLEIFKNLETLWLNSNRLLRISGLDGNFRLKRLYLQDNKITRLGEGISRLKFLEVLGLARNRIRDMQHLLEDLGALPFLLDLDLSENPVVEEDRFRLHVLAVSPKLQVLNCKGVYDLERTEARTRAAAGAEAHTHTQTVRSVTMPTAVSTTPTTTLAFSRSFSPSKRSLSPTRKHTIVLAGSGIPSRGLSPLATRPLDEEAVLAQLPHSPHVQFVYKRHFAQSQ